jgi:hypothetical protein
MGKKWLTFTVRVVLFQRNGWLSLTGTVALFRRKHGSLLTERWLSRTEIFKEREHVEEFKLR